MSKLQDDFKSVSLEEALGPQRSVLKSVASATFTTVAIIEIIMYAWPTLSHEFFDSTGKVQFVSVGLFLLELHSGWYSNPDDYF